MLSMPDGLVPPPSSLPSIGGAILILSRVLPDLEGRGFRNASKWTSRCVQVFFMARNRYIGSFRETPFVRVSLPFNLSNLQQLLKHGSCFTEPYTHQQICDWTQRFASNVHEERDKLEQMPFLEIIDDIGAQWDMWSYNTYSLNELQELDFSQVRLPHEWFTDWLRRIELASA